MQCTNPYTLTMADGQMVELPCGRCTSCKIAHAREWVVRLLHELQYAKSAYFVTLTYDDEHLPPDGSLSKKALQDFFKRLRKHLPSQSFRYYACGEYGERGNRPHYHFIGYCFSELSGFESFVHSAWRLGFVYIGTVTAQSCRYVAQYVHKKYSAKYNKFIYGDKQPPFQLQSQGLGKQYVFDNADRLLEDLCVTINGKPCGLPRYYAKKLIDERSLFDPRRKELKDELQERAVERCADVYSYWRDRGLIPYKAINAARKQADKNVVARLNLKSSKL